MLEARGSAQPSCDPYEAVLVLERDGRIVHRSLQARLWFGGAGDTLQSLQSLLAQQPAAASRLGQALRDGEPVQDVPLTMYGLPALSASCSPLPGGTLSVLSLRTAAARPAGTERCYRRMADQLPVPAWLADVSGQRSYFNRHWRALTGDGEWRDSVHADDLDAVEGAFERVRRGERQQALPHRLTDADGRQRWFVESIAPLSDESGALCGYIGISTDISLQRRHDTTIRTLSRALEQTAARIVVTDPLGDIEYVNSACCKAYGYSSEELIGRNPRLFKSGRMPPAVYDELWQTLIAGDTWRGELTNRTRDGQLLVETVTISPVRDENGRTRHYVAVKEDVTAQRAANQAQRELDARLARLERMRTVNSLAGGVAHEFNNILVAILGFSDLGLRLLSNGGDAARVVTYLKEIHAAGDRARRLVRQLRAFGKTGEQRLSKVDVRALVDELLALLDVALPSHQDVATELEPELPPLLVDQGALQQVLMNLCLNARDAMPSGGTIRISAERVHFEQPVRCDSCHGDFSGDYVCIGVADRGDGIPQDMLGNLFEPFFTTKDPAFGSGMGLPVVHGTVHQFKGHVRVDSQPGRGTRIRLHLPVADGA